MSSLDWTTDRWLPLAVGAGAGSFTKAIRLKPSVADVRNLILLDFAISWDPTLSLVFLVVVVGSSSSVVIQ
jgi:hypothetical protein